MSSPPLHLEALQTTGGYAIARVTLDNPEALNALTQALLDTLTDQLLQWRNDPRVVCVVIQGAGDRAFCAGGDIVSLYRWMRETPGQPHREAEHFLASEYRLHYAVHTFGKPVLGWGHGVAMGSGLGILVGASHKVITATTRCAMPEVGIGLFPDAGATWFLPRMPHQLGLYLGLTGTICNAGDALYVGLGDYAIDATAKDEVFDELLRQAWHGEAAHDHGVLTSLLQSMASTHQAEMPEAPLQVRASRIEQLMLHDDVEPIIAAVRAEAETDAWFERGAKALAHASPIWLSVFFEQYRRGKHLPLKAAFQLEAILAIHGVRHPDFAEGIRARLIDKDHAPRWSPAQLDEVSDERVAACFALPSDYAQNPLADL